MDKQTLLNQKLQDLKLRASAINYSNTSVNEFGELKDRESLLDQRIVEGYGCIWGSRNMHGEKFVKGCFAKSIKEIGPGSDSNYQIKFRDEHGRACSLFQELKEDNVGLYFRTVPLDAVSWSDDVLTQLKSGTLNNFSNGFNFVWDKIEYDESDDSLIVLEAKLYEISVVSIPSDLETFAIRSSDDLQSLYDLTEDFIRALPRGTQLQARQLFARHKSLMNIEPFEQRDKTLDTNEPPATGINYEYLLNNLKN